MMRKGLGMVGMMMVGLGCAGMMVGSRLAGAEDAGKSKTEGVEAKAAYARLKSLEGTWTVRFGGGPEAAKAEEHQEKHAASSATVTFRLTGAGSTVVETQFPGQGHEMLSMYHLDGEDLRMTHYCAAGNQPRLKLDRAHSRPDHLIFRFDGGSNLDPKKDLHIHGLEITFRDKDHVISAWEGYQGGKSKGVHEFNMTRQ
jgi:hypothetical protein